MAKLAINGGEPVLNRMLGKSWPIFDETEETVLLEVLRSGAWNRREKVDEVAEKFAKYHDTQYGIPLANGTVALQCALKAAGVTAGDEVIVPALTFVATGTSVVCVNAVPVIVDIDPLTYNIAPDAIEEAITSRTRAIIPVHNGGYPADMDAIMDIADRHNLKVIEDCAHAHGSQWRGKGVGSIGDFGTFSFQIGKTLTCGEGGMVITNDEQLANSANQVANLNMRMTNLQAALLLSQFERFDEQVETRGRNVEYLMKGMEEIAGVNPIPRDERVTRWCFYYWDFRFMSDEFGGISRGKFLKALNAEGVSCGVGAHGQPIYNEGPFANPEWYDQLGLPREYLGENAIDYSKVHCPQAEHVYHEEVCSFGHSMFLGDTDEMQLILDAFQKIRRNVDEL